MRLAGVRIGAPDVAEAVARYRMLLDVEPTTLASGRVRFQLARGAVEIEPGEPGLRAAVFAPDGPGDGWKEDPAGFGGLTVLVEAPPEGAPPIPAGDGAAAIDHVVVFTADPARAIALWRDRLGLRLAFDKEFPERRVRLLFFRSGGLTFEFACALPPPDDTRAPDRFHGVSYRVPQLESRRAALLAAGFDVSEIRRGNKPGTRVASVRSGTCEVPTLLLEETSDE